MLVAVSWPCMGTSHFCVSAKHCAVAGPSLLGVGERVSSFIYFAQISKLLWWFSHSIPRTAPAADHE